MGKLKEMVAAHMRAQKAREVERRVERIMGFYIEPDREGNILIGKGGQQIALTLEQAGGLQEMLASQIQALQAGEPGKGAGKCQKG